MALQPLFLTVAFFVDVKSLPKEGKQSRNTHTHTMNKIKTADKASISNTEVKSKELGLKETESNRVMIADEDEWC